MKFDSVGTASPGIGATGEGGADVRGAHPESATTTAIAIASRSMGALLKVGLQKAERRHPTPAAIGVPFTTTALSVRACNSGGIPHDPQTRQRPIPALFAKAGSEDRQAAQPRHLRQPGGCREAREGSAVLQAALIEAGTY